MNRTKLIVSGGLAVLFACSQKSPTNEKAPETRTEVRENQVEEPVNQKVEERHEYLEVQLKNQTGGLIDRTFVSFGGNQCTFGIMGEGGEKTYLGWTKPVGTNAVVSWRETQRTERRVAVNFSKIYDPTKPGILSFALVGTNIAVMFTPIDKR